LDDLFKEVNMKLTKRILIVIVGLLVAALSFAGGQEEAADAPLKIFFTNAFYSAPYCAPMNAAAKAKAEEMGIDLQIADGQADAQKQLDQIEIAIAEGVDGILYFPADQASTITVVRRLKDSGVPFLIINSRVDPSVEALIGTFVGPDYYSQGVIAGQMALEALGDDGGNVVIIEGAGGTEAQGKRSAGFEEAIAVNPNVKVLAKQQADWDPAKAMAVMEDYISKFGDDIDLVYTQDDGMWAGAAKALRNVGMIDSVEMVSIGASADGAAGVRNGELYATATQDPQLEGTKAIESIVRLINGEKLPAWIKTESIGVTIKNIDDPAVSPSVAVY
jgi:ABC-type sugar transport system substrate-binding protein